MKLKTRCKDFKGWLKANLGDYIEDLANHGADAGFPYITYTSDCVAIYNRFEDEIWSMAQEDAEEFGHKSVAEFVGTFNRSDMASDPDQFKNLLVWYACERVARELTND